MLTSISFFWLKVVFRQAAKSAGIKAIVKTLDDLLASQRAGHEARFGFTIRANQGNDEHAANRNYPLQLGDRNERREAPHTQPKRSEICKRNPNPMAL